MNKEDIKQLLQFEDGNVTYEFTEGPDGEVTAYGHVNPQHLIEEVNVWHEKCGVNLDELISPEEDAHLVEHVWVTFDEDREMFVRSNQYVDGSFPASVIWNLF